MKGVFYRREDAIGIQSHASSKVKSVHLEENFNKRLSNSSDLSDLSDPSDYRSSWGRARNCSTVNTGPSVQM